MNLFCPVCLTERAFKVEIFNLRSVYSLESTYDISSCVDCDTWITVPQLSDTQLSLHYKSIYAFDVHHWVRFEKFLRAKSLIAISKIFSEDSKVIELGTGSGVLAKQLAQKCKLVDGCELDAVSVNQSNLQKGLKISNLSAEIFLKGTDDKKYDVAVLSHVLEHFTNPVDVLSHVHRVLEDSGKILIVVPNRDSAPKFLKRYWGYWQVPIHITHFNLQSLEALLQQCGFSIETVKFRNSDFMAVGSFLSNILNRSKTSKSFGKFGYLKGLVTIFSVAYFLTYRFGSNDLIVVATKTA
jgi:ubiquinone/menaquinone biosynthesis C-methylase UbiE